MTSSMRVAITVLFGAWSCVVFAEDPPAAPLAEKAPATTTKTASPAKAAASAPAQGKKKAADRLDLDTTVVTGNRELPKVLYIVPWKKADIGDLPGQPFNTLLDEALTPVDRDVFRREVTYYGAVAAGQSTGDTTPPAESPTGKTQ